MKRYALPFFVAAFAMFIMVGSANAQQRGDDAKQASKNAEAKAKIGSTAVRVTYGSPKAKDRTVFGGLEKWGKVWRAGANEATTVTFSEDVKVNGKDLAAGVYSFFLIPKEEGNWTAIFNTVPNQWGAFDYDESKDALRVEATPMDADHQEELLYSVTGSSDSEGTLSLHWSTTKVSLTVTNN